MSAWNQLRLPAEHELLVGFYDLTGYTAFAERRAPREVLQILTGYFALTGGIIADAGGRLIKTLGDAGLCAFFDPDAGVRAMLRVQSEGDALMARQGFKSRALVKMDFGAVALGKVGAPDAEILDVYGKTVNTAAVLDSKGFAMTASAFRALSADTRTLFKKHTPPISYIAASDHR